MKNRATSNRRQRPGGILPVLTALFLALLNLQVGQAAIVNTVTATGTGVDGKPVTGSASATVDVITAAPTLTLVKAGTVDLGSDGILNAGDTISYKFTVTNTGNVTLTNVKVTDPKVTVTGGPLATLAPGAVDATTFTASYTLTQADIDAGHLANTATASGTDPSNKTVSGTGQTDTSLAPSSAMTLAKAGTVNLGSDGVLNVGDTISYKFTVTNTGNVTLTNVKVTDPKVTVTGGPLATLAPGAVDATTFTASYTLTQADIDAGHLANTATATGTDPSDKTITGTGQTDTSLAPSSALTLAKAGTVNLGSDNILNAGDTISYKFTVTNTGNVTLTNVKVTDPKVTVTGGPLATLAPGAVDATTFTASYTLTQADIDAGHMANTATASGTDPSDKTVSGTGQTDTSLAPSSALTLAKAGTVNLGSDNILNVGDTISYKFTVTNTGNVTLTNVKVTDPKVTVAGGPIAALAPGAVDATTFTASYTLTQADIDAGHMANTATASGTDPSNKTVSGTGQTDTSLAPSSALTLAKAGTVDLGSDGVLNVGDTISYKFTVTNTGNVTLTNVKVTDPKVTVTGGPLATLAPGAVDATTFTASYTLTQADIDAGHMANTATATGTDPSNKTITGTGQTDTSLAPSSALTLAKAGTVDLGSDGALNVGDTISYKFTVTNTGNVTLTNVKVTDPKVTVTGGPIASLLPGKQAVLTASYVLTQADIDAGKVDNTATATGTGTGGAQVTAKDSVTVNLSLKAAVALVKTGSLDLGSDNTLTVGDIITYHFTVTNTGNVTLTNVKVTDPKVTVAGGPIASLAPGAVDSTTFTATYALTQADLDAGHVSNQAVAAGTAPDGSAVSDLSDNSATTGDNPTDISLTPASKIALVKAVGTIADTNGNGKTDAGDTISFKLTVTNTGNVTLTNVSITDPKATVTGGPLAKLNPGQSDATTFKATHVITQADLDAGTFQNQASATGSAPGGTLVSDLSDPTSTTADNPTDTPLPRTPGIALVKKIASVTDVNGNGLNDTGDIINYVFEVTNTGDVTLTNVTVTDPLVTVSGGPLASLAPGATDKTTFAAHYTITAADLKQGQVVNQATATGTGPDGKPVTDLSDNASISGDNKTVQTLDQKAAIALVKQFGAIVDANHNGQTDAGDEIDYTFAVKNTGNVTLTNITVTDPNATVTGGPLASLDPGQSDTSTFTAKHVLTAADLAAKKVVNQATATGASGPGETVSDKSGGTFTDDNPTTTPLNQTPGIALVKRAVLPITDTNGDGHVGAGDTIHYVFFVTNTGDVTLTDVTVSDPKATVAGGPLATLAVGATDKTTFTATYKIKQADVDAGGVTNQAKANAGSSSGPVSDLSDNNNNAGDDPTITPIKSAASIALVKRLTMPQDWRDVNGDGVVDAGDSLHYHFEVTNTGNRTLRHIVVNDPKVQVRGGPLATLNPGETDKTTFSADYTISYADAQAGKVVNQATADATAPDGSTVRDLSDDSNINDNNPTIISVVKNKPGFTKTSLLSKASHGDQVPFDIVATAVAFKVARIVDIMPPGFLYGGSATANGVAVTPSINGRYLTFTGLRPDKAGTIKLRVVLIVGPVAPTGTVINKAELYDNLGQTAVATAQAALQIDEIAVFDCGDIIGRVFDDKNQNGYPDDNEPGLPGVRIATVNGLLVTTDAHGRFHVACADIPNAEIGSNFVMKLDTRTLPTGYTLTTENPRDVRLTAGKITKLNFGAAIKRVVRLTLKDAAFVPGKAALQPQWQGGIAKLIKTLEVAPSSLALTYQRGNESADLAAKRLEAVRAAIEDAWAKGQEPYQLPIDSRVVGAN